ncbi:type I polyketide synthase [Streptomyces sp. CC224B]|uniref:type I polyketide synthase n=1 Tax=Streptomyces sp. CC224B TaxID=3044571 RepID=UPI0024A9B003|nr:type I polyketide synthase [Streptomyces sp. CC224B]
MSFDHRQAPAAPPGAAQREPVAIIGVGLRFPGGSTCLEEFEAFLRSGGSGITPLPQDRWDVAAFTPAGPDDKGKIRASAGGYLDRIDLFDAGFFNISPKEAQYIDPQQRMILETAWQALEHANLDPTPLRRSNGGVYIGASSVDYALELDQLPYEELDGHLASGITLFPLAGRLSYFLGWRGPSLSVDTACSSSLAALHMAVTALRRGECDIALGGGVNALHHPRIPVMFSNAQMLAADGQCKTFDEAADGYARAEGCAVVVLKRLSDATRDGDTVLAVIRGSAVGQDGDSAGLTVPNGPAQERVLNLALADAGLAPGDISYVEAHGTGTPLGDPIELGAISNVFAEARSHDDPLPVGSVKTNLGHMEPASGLVGVIKVLLQLRTATIYPHLNFTTPSKRIPWDVYPVRVPTAAEPWRAPVRRAAVNSFGFAGTIGALVLEQAPDPAPPHAPAPAPALTATSTGTGTGTGTGTAGDGERAVPVFTLSAKSGAALREQAERYHQLLTQRPELDVARLCYTANVGRAHFSHRIAAPVTDRQDLLRVLEQARGSEQRTSASSVRKVAFMFTGQGAQYAGMGALAYAQFPLFRQVVDECEELFAPHLGRSVRDLLLGRGEGLEDIEQTRYTQPALFTLEYALARLWMSWGIKPNVLIGHSIGEVVAATVAGLFSLRDAVTLVAARSALMQSVRAPGGMAAVSAPAEQVGELLEGRPRLALAAVNGPEQCVISGARQDLAEVSAALRAQGIRVNDLAVSHAFHSPLMAEVFDDFRAALASLTFREPSISLISNLTGKVARTRELSTVEYWVRHIGEPVQFLSGIRALARRGRHAVIEIGPSAMLTALAKSCVNAEDHVWLASLRRRDTDTSTSTSTSTTAGAGATLRALADFYAAGLNVDWHAYHAGRTLPLVNLPTYAFQRKRYWLPVPARRAATGGGPLSHPLLGEAAPQEDLAPGTAEFTATCVPGDAGEALVAHHGRPALAPAALIDLLFAAQDAWSGHTRGALAELRLPQVLVLGDEEAAFTLTTRLRRLEEGGIEAEVTATTGEDTRTLATARITAPSPAPALRPPATGSGTAVEHLDGADLATDLRAVGAAGEHTVCRLRSAVRHSDGTISGELRGRSAGPVEQLPGEVLHSALAAVAGFADDGPRALLRSAECVRLWKKPRGGPVRFTALPRPDSGQGQGLRMDVLLSEGEEPLAEVRGALLAAVPGQGEPPPFLHRVEWLRRRLPAPTTAPAPARHVLLHHPAPGAGSGVYEALTARPAPENLQLSTAGGAQELAAALRPGEAAPVTDVAFFWQPGEGAWSLGRLRAECAHNFTRLLELVAAVSAAPTAQPPRLWLVTERAQHLPGDGADGAEHLAAATVWGFGSVLLGEYPQLKATLVDLPAGGDAAALLAEWQAPASAEYQVAYRAGQRYVRRVLPAGPGPEHPVPAAALAVLAGPADTEGRTGPEGLAGGVGGEEQPLGAGRVRVRVHAAALATGAPEAVESAEAAEGGGGAGPQGSPQAAAAGVPRAPVAAAAGTVLAAGPGTPWAAGTEVLLGPGTVAGPVVTVEAGRLTRRTVAADPVEAAARAATGCARHPAQVYRLEESQEALRAAAGCAADQAVVIDLRPPAQAPRPAGEFTVRADRTYLVTGGLGGLGLATAHKLVELGARHLVLVSRSGTPAAEAAGLLHELSARAQVHQVRADLGQERDVAGLVARLHRLEHPVGGIVHAAGAMGNALISALTWPAIEEQLAPKVYGGWLLHEAAKSFAELDFFTVYSSVASVTGVRGGAGQAHYAAAFSFLDALAHWRGRQGLPALSVNWGSWGRVGMSARMEAAHVREIERSGVRLFSPAWGLRALHRLWQHGAVQRVVNVYDWPQFCARLPVAGALYEQVAAPDGGGEDTGGQLADLLARERPERLKLISRAVAEKVAAVLHFASVEEVEPEADFVSMGLDSVMGMEVKGALQSHFGLGLPASLIFDHPSVQQVAAFVEAQLARSGT